MLLCVVILVNTILGDFAVWAEAKPTDGRKRPIYNFPGLMTLEGIAPSPQAHKEMRIGSSGNILNKQETERGKEKRPNLFSTFMPMIIAPLTGQIKQTELQKNILDQEIMAQAKSWGEVQLNPHLLEDEPYALHVDTNEDDNGDSLDQLAQHGQSETYKFRAENDLNKQPIKHEQPISLDQPPMKMKDLISLQKSDSQSRNIRKLNELTPVLPVKVENLSPIQDSNKVLQLFKVKGLVPNDTLNQTTITKISELIPFDKLNQLDSKSMTASRHPDKTKLENDQNQARMNNLPAIDKSENLVDNGNSYHVSINQVDQTGDYTYPNSNKPTISNPLPIKNEQLIPVNKLQEIKTANQQNGDLNQSYETVQPIETRRDKEKQSEDGMYEEHGKLLNSHKMQQQFKSDQAELEPSLKNNMPSNHQSSMNEEVISSNLDLEANNSIDHHEPKKDMDKIVDNIHQQLRGSALVDDQVIPVSQVTTAKDIKQFDENHIENESSNQPTSYNHFKSEPQTINEAIINHQPNNGLDVKTNTYDDQNTNSNPAFDESGEHSIKLSDLREISSNNDPPNHDFDPNEKLLSEINTAPHAEEESVESQIDHNLNTETSASKYDERNGHYKDLENDEKTYPDSVERFETYSERIYKSNEVNKEKSTAPVYIESAKQQIDYNVKISASENDETNEQFKTYKDLENNDKKEFNSEERFESYSSMIHKSNEVNKDSIASVHKESAERQSVDLNVEKSASKDDKTSGQYKGYTEFENYDKIDSDIIHESNEVYKEKKNDKIGLEQSTVLPYHDSDSEKSPGSFYHDLYFDHSGGMNYNNFPNDFEDNTNNEENNQTDNSIIEKEKPSNDFEDDMPKIDENDDNQTNNDNEHISKDFEDDTNEIEIKDDYEGDTYDDTHVPQYEFDKDYPVSNSNFASKIDDNFKEKEIDFPINNGLSLSKIMPIFKDGPNEYTKKIIYDLKPKSGSNNKAKHYVYYPNGKPHENPSTGTETEIGDKYVGSTKKYDSNDKYTSTQEGSEEKGLPSSQESQNFNSDDNSMDKGPGTQKAFEDSEELHDIIRRQEEREIIKSELNSKRQATYPVSGPSYHSTSHEAQQESSGNANFTILEKSNNTLPSNNQTRKLYEEMRVDPAHLACIVRSEPERIPDEKEKDFERRYGMLSEPFIALMNYSNGHNSKGQIVPLMYPVTIKVTPHSNNTVTRSICIIINKFSEKVPPAMENHLKIIHLAAPYNEEIQLSTAGLESRLSRNYRGSTNDYMYRVHARDLLETITRSDAYGQVDLNSYYISISRSKSEYVFSVGFRAFEKDEGESSVVIQG